MLAILKPNKLRICIEAKDLNHGIRREHYQLATIDEVASRLAGAKKFTLCDAKEGFHQILLDDASSFLTTFKLPALDAIGGLVCFSAIPALPKFVNDECRSLLKTLRASKSSQTISSSLVFAKLMRRSMPALKGMNVHFCTNDVTGTSS